MVVVIYIGNNQMIKIEKISKDGNVQAGNASLYEGQLITFAEYQNIKVISGEVLVSIDEKELVTLKPELVTEQSPKLGDLEEKEPAPMTLQEANKDLHTSAKSPEAEKKETGSAKSPDTKSSTLHSAKSPSISKK